MDQVKYELATEEKVKNETLERVKSIVSTVLLLLFAATMSAVLGYFFYHLDTPGGTILFKKLRIRLLPLRHLEWRNSAGKTLLEGHLGVNFPEHVFHDIYGKNDTFMHVHWTNQAELIGRWWRDIEHQFECYHFSWKSLTCANNAIQDCFSLQDTHWYGGGIIPNQTWPIETWSIREAPFLTGDPEKDTYGGILSRYWLSSKGVGIFVDWESPLWVSVNASGDQKLCLKAMYANPPYWQKDMFTPLRLSYKMCIGPNMRAVHWYMTKKFLQYPRVSPSLGSMDMIINPLWSLTPSFPHPVNVSDVLKLARSALAFYPATNSTAILRLENIIFNDTSNVRTGPTDGDIRSYKELITCLSNMGFRVSIFRSPSLYLNNTLRRTDGVEKTIFEDPTEVHILPRIRWKTSVGQLKDATTKWFQKNVKVLQKDLSVSFSFHGGNALSLPLNDIVIQGLGNPDSFTLMYHQMASNLDPDSIFDSASGPQNLSAFVTMRNRKLSWDANNGLRSIIPEALTLGVIGYPYIIAPGLNMADILEGSVSRVNSKSEIAELYIRWLQTVSLFPVVRFTIQPSYFPRNMTRLADDIWRARQKHTSTIQELAREAWANRVPILRPVWWIAPTDQNAQILDDQFMLGNYLMVAPVLRSGTSIRSIYLPKGNWIDLLRNETVIGPRWLHRYSVSLAELPLFALNAQSWGKPSLPYEFGTILSTLSRRIF